MFECVDRIGCFCQLGDALMGSPSLAWLFQGDPLEGCEPGGAAGVKQQGPIAFSVFFNEFRLVVKVCFVLRS